MIRIVARVDAPCNVVERAQGPIDVIGSAVFVRAGVLVILTTRLLTRIVLPLVPTWLLAIVAAP